ncbi:MAG: hypothetical protein GF317_08050 [Candidatus Lokiarchaeota archaeon]|nr:hypothetical protein [Candidatus Lokiarchaeota archaeon]MBD3199665.1 hypothetical protein [Candidatus Lokiarchaeota archaeon]
MEINEELKESLMERMDYSSEELDTFLNNPRNKKVLAKSLNLLGKTIIFEVVESHGCNTLHKVGDKFYFDGAGNLLTKLSPKKICIYALAELDKLIFASNELLYAGVDPNEIVFDKASCFDVGLKCGGWGQIIMKISVVERESIEHV